ncbi:MAG: ethanolamine utilization protein EutH [Lachnospiraceae bacterium]|nr:ethanolamine utilization protein EutH [Lachnospiraceae bacterium]
MGLITTVMLIFSILGAMDRIIGNRFGLGKEFEKGFLLLGAMSLSMTGMLVITPWLAQILEPVFSFVWRYLHIDPSVVPAILFANDMGGAPMATQIAVDSQIGGFNALIVSSMMGATISFTIPYALGVVREEQHKNMFLGILCGIVVIPLGCLVSGIVLKIPIGKLLFDLFPLIIFSLLLALGLLKFTDICVRLFNGFAIFVRSLITVGLIVGVVQFLTGKYLLSPIASLEEGTMVCLNASVVLSGAFPLMYLISKLLVKPLRFIGGKFGINEVSAIGFASTLVSNAPTFGVMNKMDEKGVVMNSAFAVSAAFVFGSHLAFTMAFDETYLSAMLIGKVVSGVLALFVANYVYETKK